LEREVNIFLNADRESVVDSTMTTESMKLPSELRIHSPGESETLLSWTCASCHRRGHGPTLWKQSSLMATAGGTTFS
jgi:hypothetical protein